jgi:hypothetical protein
LTGGRVRPPLVDLDPDTAAEVAAVATKLAEH